MLRWRSPAARFMLRRRSVDPRGPAVELIEDGEDRWRIPRHGGMLVDGLVFTSKKLIVKAKEDRALAQVANVAHLPGIVGESMAMPDIHWGYGFPIGGVAATDVEAGGVSHPGAWASTSAAASASCAPRWGGTRCRVRFLP